MYNLQLEGVNAPRWNSPVVDLNVSSISVADARYQSVAENSAPDTDHTRLTNGDHFFYSTYIRLHSDVELHRPHQMFKVHNTLVCDKDLSVAFNFSVGDDEIPAATCSYVNFLMTENNRLATKGKTAASHGVTTLGACFSFGLAESPCFVHAADALQGVWLCWYYNIKDNDSFELFVNGVPHKNIVKGDATFYDNEGRHRRTAVDKRTHYGAYGVRDYSGALTEVEFAHQMFCSSTKRQHYMHPEAYREKRAIQVEDGTVLYHLGSHREGPLKNKANLAAERFRVVHSYNTSCVTKAFEQE